MLEDERFFADYARGLPDADLWLEIFAIIDDTLDTPVDGMIPSGPLRVVELFLDEIVRRHPDLEIPIIADLRRQLRETLAKTGMHGGEPIGHA